MKINKRREIHDLDIFIMDGEDITLSIDLQNFFENNILSNINLTSTSEVDDIIIINSSLSKEKVEKYVDLKLDSAVCKVIARTLQSKGFISLLEDQIYQITSAEGYVVKIKEVTVEFENNEFVIAIVCIK